MLKMKLEHGKPSGDNPINKSNYLMRMTIYDSVDKHFSDILMGFPFLSKLSEEELDFLCHELNRNHLLLSESVLGLRNVGCAYQEPIAKAIKETLD